MVFTSEHRRFIIESYFRNSAFNNQDGNSSLEFVVHFCLDRNSCAGLKGLCPSPGIKYYADGNSCAPKKRISAELFFKTLIDLSLDFFQKLCVTFSFGCFHRLFGHSVYVTSFSMVRHFL
jgi:hypothetical protein